MGAAYAQDLRDRVLSAYDRGMETKQISDLFGVSRAWAKRIKQVRREQDRLTPLPMGGVRVIKVDLQQLRKLVDQQPDATIAELHQRLGTDRCSKSAVGMALIRLGLSFKKRRFTRPSRTGPMLLKNGLSGNRSNPHARPNVSSSSTKRGQKPT